MHIGDGILSSTILATGGVLTIAGTAWGLKKIDYEQVPKAAMFSSAFFVIGLIHFPFLGTSTHLLLNGLIGLVLGPASFPVILISLLIQSLIFMHGGLLSIGVNVANIAIPAILVYFIFNPILRSRKAGSFSIYMIGFMAGSISFLLSLIMTSLAIFLSDPEKMSTIAQIFIAVNSMLVLIEGVMSGFMVVFLMKIKPEIFK